jgi:hypothetical protein
MMYFGEGMAEGMARLFERELLIADLLVPDVGFQHGRRIGNAVALSWPLALSFGRPTSTVVHRYHCAEDAVEELRPHRVALEPGLSFTGPTTFWLRLGYAYVVHPASARFGLGLGAGITLSGRDGETSAAAGPELSLRYGHCCWPGYLALTVRYDLALTDSADRTLTVKVGLSFL